MVWAGNSYATNKLHIKQSSCREVKMSYEQIYQHLVNLTAAAAGCAKMPGFRQRG
jgi:hypothetical protein